MPGGAKKGATIEQEENIIFGSNFYFTIHTDPAASSWRDQLLGIGSVGKRIDS